MWAFSVDLEDWYQGIELPYSEWSNYKPRLEIGAGRVLDILDRQKTKATFFTLGWIAQKHPELIRDIARRGHELASHGFSHEKVYHLSPEKFREEIRTTKHILEDITGTAVTAHRSPFFTVTSKTLWALSILAEEGYKIDCSISPVKTWRYGISGCPDEIYRIREAGITEFPASTFNFLGKRWAIGGAYFRLLPYLLTRQKLRERKKTDKPTMFYVHPWEFDPEHPSAPMEWKARLTHYTRLEKTSPYTEQMLGEFKYDTVSNTVKKYADKHPLREISLDLLKN